MGWEVLQGNVIWVQNRHGSKWPLCPTVFSMLYFLTEYLSIPLILGLKPNHAEPLSRLNQYLYQRVHIHIVDYKTCASIDIYGDSRRWTYMEQRNVMYVVHLLQWSGVLFFTVDIIRCTVNEDLSGCRQFLVGIWNWWNTFGNKVITPHERIDDS